MDINKVKSLSTSWHPSRNDLSVSLHLETGKTEHFVIPEEWCENLVESIRRMRESYIPWIEEWFSLVAGDGTWECLNCAKRLEADSRYGGIIMQMGDHMRTVHAMVLFPGKLTIIPAASLK